MTPVRCLRGIRSQPFFRPRGKRTDGENSHSNAAETTIPRILHVALLVFSAFAVVAVAPGCGSGSSSSDVHYPIADDDDNDDDQTSDDDLSPADDDIADDDNDNDNDDNDTTCPAGHVCGQVVWPGGADDDQPIVAQVQLLNNATGDALDGADPVVTGADGRFALAIPSAPVSMVGVKASPSAAGSYPSDDDVSPDFYVDSFVYNVDVSPLWGDSVGVGTWPWDFLVATVRGLAGISLDQGAGVIFGQVVSATDHSFVGCAQVTVDPPSPPGDFTYAGNHSQPETGLSGTNPINGMFYSFNEPVGQNGGYDVEATLQIDRSSTFGAAHIPRLRAHAMTMTPILLAATTPANCHPPLDDDDDASDDDVNDDEAGDDDVSPASLRLTPHSAFAIPGFYCPGPDLNRHAR